VPSLLNFLIWRICCSASYILRKWLKLCFFEISSLKHLTAICIEMSKNALWHTWVT
jgi:hypothetical protein